MILIFILVLDYHHTTKCNQVPSISFHNHCKSPPVDKTLHDWKSTWQGLKKNITNHYFQRQVFTPTWCMDWIITNQWNHFLNYFVKTRQEFVRMLTSTRLLLATDKFHCICAYTILVHVKGYRVKGRTIDVNTSRFFNLLRSGTTKLISFLHVQNVL